MLNKQINDILDTVDLAFLYFNKDLKINKNSSEKCLKIFQQNKLLKKIFQKF
jgi:hypothetical protein